MKWTFIKVWTEFKCLTLGTKTNLEQGLISLLGNYT